jgi:nitroreductase
METLEIKQMIGNGLSGNMPFNEVVRLRRSCRGFLPTVVQGDIITSVLEDAALAPSNCNTQPWQTHIISGEKLKELSEALLKENQAQKFSPDFSFDLDDYHGRYKERHFGLGKAMYEAFGVGREDKEGRRATSNLNYEFFGAPHVAIPFMPSFGDNVRVGGDIGMYGQTFLLSLTAHGLAGIPQTSLGFFAGTIKEILNVPDELKIMFGISFGYADPNSPGNTIHVGRDPLARTVVYHK